MSSKEDIGTFGVDMVGRKFHVMHILYVKPQTEKEPGLVWEVKESSRPGTQTEGKTI